MNDLKQETDRLLQIAESPVHGNYTLQRFAEHIRNLQAQADQLTAERDEARRLATAWSNEGGSEIRRLESQVDALRLKEEGYIAITQTAMRVWRKYGSDKDWTEWTDLGKALGILSKENPNE